MLTEREEKVLMYGESYMAKNEIFEEKMNAIAEKYKYWFESRPGKDEFHEHDHLGDHYILYYSGASYRFAKNADSDLPDEIWNECVEASRIAFGG